MKTAIFAAVVAAIAALSSVSAARADDLLALHDYTLVGRSQYFMPAAAQDEQREGTATLECKVLDADGTLNCATVDERPTGFHFGDAALKSMAGRKAVTTDPAHPIIGRSFRQPFYFKYADRDFFLVAVPDYHAALDAFALANFHKTLKDMHVGYSASRLSCTILDEAGHVSCTALVDRYPKPGMLDAVIDSLDHDALAAPFKADTPMTGESFSVDVM